MGIESAGTYGQPLLAFLGHNALASSSVKNGLLCCGDRRMAALKFNFGSSKTLREGNVFLIESLRKGRKWALP